MIFSAKDGLLHPVDLGAKTWISGREGNVDIMPLSKGKRRSLDANAKYWAWCHEIEQQGGYDTGYAHKYNKWHFGLAILTRKYPELRARLLSMLREMSYDDRLDAMDLIDCTRKFTVTEMSEYMDTVQRHWVTNGIVIE